MQYFWLEFLSLSAFSKQQIVDRGFSILSKSKEPHSYTVVGSTAMMVEHSCYWEWSRRCDSHGVRRCHAEQLKARITLVVLVKYRCINVRTQLQQQPTTPLVPFLKPLSVEPNGVVFVVHGTQPRLDAGHSPVCNTVYNKCAC